MMLAVMICVKLQEIASKSSPCEPGDWDNRRGNRMPFTACSRLAAGGFLLGLCWQEDHWGVAWALPLLNKDRNTDVVRITFARVLC